MKSYTLSQYQTGDTEYRPQGSCDAVKGYIPVEYVFSLSPADYFGLANELMSGREKISRYSKLNF